MEGLQGPLSPRMPTSIPLPSPGEAETSRTGRKRPFVDTAVSAEDDSPHASTSMHDSIGREASWLSTQPADKGRTGHASHSRTMHEPRNTTQPLNVSHARLSHALPRPAKRRCAGSGSSSHRRSNSLPDTFTTARDPRLIPLPPLTSAQLLELHATSLSADSATLFVPQSTPPVNKSSLAELDSREMLQNRQLRMDIVFDERLTFRPNYDGERGKRKRLAHERFWDAVGREIATGCRCACYMANGAVAPCLCHLFRSRLSSRILPVVNELLILLLSLMPSQASRARIIEVLSPGRPLDGRLAQEASMAVGETLLQHCAPMRDPLVRQMMALAGSGPRQSAQALRMAFEIGELMKLDIANHQLRRMRPYIVMSVVPFAKRIYQGLSPKQLLEVFPKTLATYKSKPTQQVIAATVVDFMIETDSLFVDASLSKVPETLHQDLLRLGDLNAAFADLLFQYIALLLAGQLDSAKGAVLEQLRSEVPVVAGLPPLQRSAGVPQAPARVGLSRFANGTWRQEVLPAVGAHIASRLDQDVELVTNFLDHNTRTSSFFFSLVRRRLANSIKLATQRHLRQERAREMTGRHWWTPLVSVPTSPEDESDQCRRRFDKIMALDEIVRVPSPPANNDEATFEPTTTEQRDEWLDMLRKNGLVPLADQIDILAERIARVVSFHWAVYSSLYKQLFR